MLPPCAFGATVCKIAIRAVVLNLIGGTEPCKFHQCIHRTLRNWKNKIWFLQNIFPLFLYTHESILYVFVQPLSFFARQLVWRDWKIKRKSQMTYNHNSNKFPAAQISKPSNVAWSAAANDGQAERDVTTNTSGLNLFCGLLGGGNNTRRGKDISRGEI